MDDAEYEEVGAELSAGGCLLIFSDGAFEIHNARDEQLGMEGLLRILRGQGYPQKPLQREAVEEEFFPNGLICGRVASSD